MRAEIAGFGALVLLSMVGCGPATPAGTRTTRSGFELSPHSSSTPLPMSSSSPSALPTTPPVAHVAGWQEQDSPNWVGYTFLKGDVTGVRAQWLEPMVTGEKGDEEFVWLGIGGWAFTLDNLIQVGTFAYFPSTGAIRQGSWYELVPVDGTAQFRPGINVSPGDRIFASIVELQQSARVWEMQLVDVTAGESFDRVIEFNSLRTYPAFVVEDPTNGPSTARAGPYDPFPHWGTVTFSSMQVRIGEAWTSAAALRAYRWRMVRNGSVLAAAGPVSVDSGFSSFQ